jgi:hypothetical protein
MGALRLTRATLAALCLTALVSCNTTKSSHCTAFEAIRPSQAQIDVMTDAEVERALVELEKFRRICGVKP